MNENDPLWAVGLALVSGVVFGLAVYWTVWALLATRSAP